MAEFRRRRAKLRVKAEEIDYKNVDLLKRFVSAIKRARNIALIPYTRIEK